MAVAVADNNVGYRTRRLMFNQSTTVRIILPLVHFPFLAFHKPLPPNTKLTLKFHMDNTVNCLQGATAGGGNRALARNAKIALSNQKITVQNLFLDPSDKAVTWKICCQRHRQLGT